MNVGRCRDGVGTVFGKSRYCSGRVVQRFDVVFRGFVVDEAEVFLGLAFGRVELVVFLGFAFGRAELEAFLRFLRPVVLAPAAPNGLVTLRSISRICCTVCTAFGRSRPVVRDSCSGSPVALTVSSFSG